MGSFLFRWPYPASGDVYVTGSFDDWGKTEKLNQVGEGYEKEVKLSSADKKITYKFVVDGNWVIDEAAPKEDDGSHNVNNVLLPENINKGVSSTSAAAAQNSGRVTSGHRIVGVSDSPPGSASFDSNAVSGTAAAVTAAPVVSAPSDGAPLLTKEQSEANFARVVPQVDAPADRPVTRSLEEAKSDTAGASDVPGAFPETPANESESVSVNPIPATGHDNIQDTVTTSKEDYEKAGTSSGPGAFVVAGGAAAAGVAGVAAASAFSKPSGKENIIPESSLPMDAGKMDTMDKGPFISSSAGAGTTTSDLASKVPLEQNQFVSSSAGQDTTTASLASKVPLEQKRQGMFVDPKDAPAAAAVPSAVKESMSEANQGTEAAGSADVVAEKTAMEKELTSKVPTSEAAGAPESAAAAQTSYHGLATSVPQTVEQSMAKADAAPEAASSTAVVAEKTAMEKELLSEVPKSDAAGEHAPTDAAATSATAPAAAAAVKESNGPLDSALAEEPAVKMMAQNEGATTATGAATTSAVTDSKAPEAKVPETPKKTDNKAVETPKKDAGTANTGTGSAASTPAKKTDTAASSPATGEKSKKKNRLSRIWHKIVD